MIKRSTRAATSKLVQTLFKFFTDRFDSRDDKRYTEKKNKSERARRKKEDTARLRGIVDLCLGLDPRIKRIKQEEKDAREAKKKAKAPAQSTKAKEEEEKKKAEEDAKKKEEEEAVRIALFRFPTLSNLFADCSCGCQESEGCCCKCCQKGPQSSARWRIIFLRSIIIALAHFLDLMPNPCSFGHTAWSLKNQNCSERPIAVMFIECMYIQNFLIQYLQVGSVARRRWLKA